MKRLWWLAIPLLLAACTGTQSEQPPILLFVTHSAGGVHTAALIEDDQFSDPRFTYLEDTETVLAGEPVAFDVADRAGDRSEIVLLLETAANEYAALWYDVQDIIPAAAGPLNEARPSVDLTAVLVPELNEAGDLCLTDLQTTFGGELLAVLNVPHECNSATTAAPSIFLVDSQGDFEAELATSLSLQTSGLYINQGNESENDVLHFLDYGGGAVRLREAALPAGTVDNVSRAFPTGSDNPEPQQLTFTNDSFVALQPGTLNVLGETSGFDLQTSSANHRVIADPYGNQLQAFLVLQTGSGGQLHIRDAASWQRVQSLGNPSSGTVEPVQMWVYLLEAGALRTVDLMEILELGNDDSSVTRRWLLSELGTPGLITWFQGLLEVVPELP